MIYGLTSIAEHFRKVPETVHRKKVTGREARAEGDIDSISINASGTANGTRCISVRAPLNGKW